MSKLLSNTRQARASAFAALKKAGVPEQRAAVGALPEVHPNFVQVQARELDRLPAYVAASKATAAYTNKLMVKDDLQKEYVGSGESPEFAKNVSQAVADSLPAQGDNYIQYKKILEKFKVTGKDLVVEPVEDFLRKSGIMKDLDMATAAVGATAGALQQGLFSNMIRENPGDSLDRIWPHADVRDDDGTLQRKAVVPLALKSMSFGVLGMAFDGIAYAMTGNTPMRDQARKYAEALVEADYRDDLLTGQEVIEYWANGNGLFFGVSPPDKDSPERAAFDMQVRDEFGQNMAALSDKRGGAWAMAGIAVGGAVLDVVADPILPVSSVGKSMTIIGKALLPASSRARVTAAIADRTGRLEHTLAAVTDAKDWADEAVQRYKNSPTEQNKIHMDHAQKTEVRMKAQLETFAAGPQETFAFPVNPRVHPDHIRDVSQAYHSVPYESRKVAAMRLVRDRLNESRKNVTATEKAIERAKGTSEDLQRSMFTAEQVGDDLPALERRLREQIAVRDSWKETRDSLSARFKNPGARTSAFLDEATSKSKPYASAAVSAGKVPAPDMSKKRVAITDKEYERIIQDVQANAEDATGKRLSPDEAAAQADAEISRMGNAEGIEVSRAVPEEPLVATKAEVLAEINENIKRGIAQGVDEEEIIQWEHTYTQVSNGPDTFTGPVQRSTKSYRDILYESMAAQRRRILSEDPSPIANYENADPVQAAQRAIYGPDQREAAAEAARILAAGGEIDDMAFHGMGVDIYNSSYGEKLFPSSGGEARALDAEWLGTDAMRTHVEAAEWQRNVAEKMGDFFARGLYPNTWNLRPAGILNQMREPMRVLQSINPRMYTRVHNALNAQKFEVTRMNEVFSRELQILGVYREVKGSMVMDPEASKKFYQIMNMVPSGEKYDLAMRGLSETERRSLRRLRQEMDFMGDKLGLRNTDKYLEGYIDHVWDKHWSDHGTRMQEVRGLGASTDVRAPIMMTREGNTGYVEDLALALDNYARGSSRKLHFEPMFKDLEASKAQHLKFNPGDTWYAQYVDHMINNFKGRPSTLGEWVDINLSAMNARMRAHETMMDTARGVGTAMERQGNVMGTVGAGLSRAPGKLGKLGGAMQAEGVRVSEFGSEIALKGMPLYGLGDASRTAMGVTALVYASVLGGSGRYFPMAVATGLATTGSRYGIFNTVRGIVAMGTKEGRALAKQAGLDKQWVQVLEDAAWTKIGKLATNMPTFNGVTVVGPSISATENLVRGWTFHAALGDLTRKQGFQSWDEVVEAGFAKAYLHEATRITEEVNHLFGQLGKPPAFHRLSKSGSVATTQFLSFIPKQLEELMAQTMMDPGKITQYMAISGYIQRVAAKAGMDVTSYVGTGFIPESPDDVTSITMETMSSVVGWGADLAKLMDGSGDALTAHRSGENVVRNVRNFIPFAVTTHRFKRTYDALRTGALYSDKGALLYEYDLGGYEWDDSKSVGANLLALPAKLPGALGEPGKPSDIAGIMSGLNSPRQTLERQQYRAMRTASQNAIYRQSRVVDALEESIRTGNGDEFSRQLALASKEGVLLPDLSEAINRSAYENALPRLLREQIASQQAALNAASELPRLRALHELQFGYEGE